MKRVAEVFLCILTCSYALAQTADAGFFFSLSTSSTNVAFGEKAVFNIVIESTDAVSISGIDLGLRTTHGSFVEPISNLFFLSQSNQDWDLNEPGEAVYSKASQNVLLDANAPRAFATLKIDTTGLLVGTEFTVSFDNNIIPNVANNTSNQAIPGIELRSPIVFTITAVPEPSSIAFCRVGLSAIFARRCLSTSRRKIGKQTLL